MAILISGENEVKTKKNQWWDGIELICSYDYMNLHDQFAETI